MHQQFYKLAGTKDFKSVTSIGILISALCVLPFANVSCTKAEKQADSNEADPQYKPAPGTVVKFSGHSSDCNTETLHANESTILGDYKFVLDKSWGQGVEIYLQNPQDPMSLTCSHPRRRIGGRTNTLRGAVISVDGRNPIASAQNAFQPQPQTSPYFRFVNVQGKTFIAYEEKPGGCNPLPNSAPGTLSDGCIVWGYVKSDRSIRLVNASCVGGYRVSGVVDPAKTNLLFNQNSISDLRGYPLNNCFILTKKLFANQPPTYSPEWDRQPSQPGYPGARNDRSGGNYSHGTQTNNRGTPPDSFPPNRGHDETNDRNVVSDVVIDALFTIGQYKLCRDASPRNFQLTSGLACRLGGFLSHSPLFDECIRECRRLFELKQKQNGQQTKN